MQQMLILFLWGVAAVSRVADPVATRAVLLKHHHVHARRAGFHRLRGYPEESISHEDAIEAMGDMSIHDLMHPDLFDDDFVNDGDPKYKLVHEAHQKYTKRAKKMDAAKEKLEAEADALHQAELKEKTLENVVEQKKAELTDAKENVNATGTLDEEAELSNAEKHLEEVKAEEEEFQDEIDSDAAIMKEAREKLPKLQDKLVALRKDHGVKYANLEAAREKYKSIAELKDRKKKVESELKKVAKIKEKLLEEESNVIAILDSKKVEAAELNQAEMDEENVAAEIEATEEESKRLQKALDDAQFRVTDAQKTKLPAAQGETIHAEEQVQAKEEELHEAEESFYQEEYDAAVADEKKTEEEYD